MIFSIIFLFLILLSASAVIYYLYAFFIPALKLKNKEYNDLLASNFNFKNDFDDMKTTYNVLLPEEKKNDEIFNSIYRSKIADEKICISFDENATEKNFNDEFSQNSDSDNENLEKRDSKGPKCFKFWIYCYKLLDKRKSAKLEQNWN